MSALTLWCFMQEPRASPNRGWKERQATRNSFTASLSLPVSLQPFEKISQLFLLLVLGCNVLELFYIQHLDK